MVQLLLSSREATADDSLDTTCLSWTGRQDAERFVPQCKGPPAERAAAWTSYIKSLLREEDATGVSALSPHLSFCAPFLRHNEEQSWT